MKKIKKLKLTKEIISTLDAKKMSNLIGGYRSQDTRTGSCNAYTEVFTCCPYGSQIMC